MSINYFDPIKGDAGEKIDALETILKACVCARRKHEPRWRTNILFLRGYQWNEVVSTPAGSRKIDVSTPSSKVKLGLNQIYPLARQAAALLVDNISQPIAAPSTMEPQDVYAAEIATDLLMFRQEEDKEIEKRRVETLWAMTCGLVMRYTHWDPEAASILPNGKVMGAGDISTIMLNPWQYAISPWAKSADDSPVLAFTDVRPVSEINDIYGSDVEEEEVKVDEWLLERDMSGMVSDTLGSGASFQAPKHAAALKTLFVAPTSKYPKGRKYVWANKVLLAETDLPEEEMPTTAISWFPTPGSPYPLEFVTPLVEPQRQINITMSQLIEIKNRQLRGDLLVLGNGELTEEDQPIHEFVDGETGRKTIYGNALVREAKFFEYNLDVSTAEYLLAELYNKSNDIAGIREATMGRTQPSGTPAATTLALKESDLSGLTIFRHGFNLAHSRIGSQKLIIARNHYKIPRQIRIVGEQNAVKVNAFIGADLRSTEDVRVETTPMLTETEKNVIASQLKAQGAYGPYEGPEHQLAMIRLIETSGLPNAREDAEKQCSPMTLEELEGLVGEINAKKAQLMLIQLETTIQQLTAPPPEQQPTGMEELPPEAQMVMAGQQMAQPPPMQ